MNLLRKFCCASVLIFLSFFAVVAQNRFEGYNIIVDAPDVQTQALGACATRYVQPSTQITIADLNTETPMRLQSCGGNSISARQTNATTAIVRASDVDYKWCFVGEDKMYRISFEGDRFAGKITYNWIATPSASELGFYNVRDFGAKGDGQIDDTVAVRSALAFIATRGGGRLLFPDGDYPVGNAPEYPNYKGLTVPSGIIIEGTGSVNSGAPINNVVKRNASRITLQGQNRALFRIGECTERVAIRDLELYAQSDQNTYGIEAVGAFTSSQDFYFDQLAITKFFRGIYARALAVNNQQWQFDFIKINNTRFNFNRDAAIWTDLWNTDWAIRSSFIQAPKKTATAAANGIYFFKNGIVLIEDSSGGAPPGEVGGDFINISEANNTTIISSQCEKMTRSLVFGDVPGAGNLGYNITLIGNVFGNPIEIKARKTLVSTGNFYGPGTVRLHPDARLYSTGDRFCIDGFILGCNSEAGPTNFIGGKIIFSTGQPGEGSVAGRPTVFGHDVQFKAPIQLSSLPFNELPKQNMSNGSFVYCSNCQRNTSPCQAGGAGAPATSINGKWNCL